MATDGTHRRDDAPSAPDVRTLVEELLVLEEHEDPGPAVTPAAEGLSAREVELLDFERQWWKHPGSKEEAVRERFGVGPTRYYQLVNALLDREAALRHDPMLVKRLRRARTQRRRARTARRLGLEP